MSTKTIIGRRELFAWVERHTKKRMRDYTDLSDGSVVCLLFSLVFSKCRIRPVASQTHSHSQRAHMNWSNFKKGMRLLGLPSNLVQRTLIDPLGSAAAVGIVTPKSAVSVIPPHQHQRPFHATPQDEQHCFCALALFYFLFHVGKTPGFTAEFQLDLSDEVADYLQSVDSIRALVMGGGMDIGAVPEPLRTSILKAVSASSSSGGSVRESFERSSSSEDDERIGRASNVSLSEDRDSAATTAASESKRNLSPSGSATNIPKSGGGTKEEGEEATHHYQREGYFSVSQRDRRGHTADSQHDETGGRRGRSTSSGNRSTSSSSSSSSSAPLKSVPMSVRQQRQHIMSQGGQTDLLGSLQYDYHTHQQPQQQHTRTEHSQITTVNNINTFDDSLKDEPTRRVLDVDTSDEPEEEAGEQKHILGSTQHSSNNSQRAAAPRTTVVSSHSSVVSSSDFFSTKRSSDKNNKSTTHQLGNGGDEGRNSHLSSTPPRRRSPSIPEAQTANVKEIDMSAADSPAPPPRLSPSKAAKASLGPTHEYDEKTHSLSNEAGHQSTTVSRAQEVDRRVHWAMDRPRKKESNEGGAGAMRSAEVSSQGANGKSYAPYTEAGSDAKGQTLHSSYANDAPAAAVLEAERAMRRAAEDELNRLKAALASEKALHQKEVEDREKRVAALEGKGELLMKQAQLLREEAAAAKEEASAAKIQTEQRSVHVQSVEQSSPSHHHHHDHHHPYGSTPPQLRGNYGNRTAVATEPLFSSPAPRGPSVSGEQHQSAHKKRSPSYSSAPSLPPPREPSEYGMLRRNLIGSELPSIALIEGGGKGGSSRSKAAPADWDSEALLDALPNPMLEAMSNATGERFVFDPLTVATALSTWVDECECGRSHSGSDVDVNSRYKERNNGAFFAKDKIWVLVSAFRTLQSRLSSAKETFERLISDRNELLGLVKNQQIEMDELEAEVRRLETSALAAEEALANAKGQTGALVEENQRRLTQASAHHRSELLKVYEGFTKNEEEIARLSARDAQWRELCAALRRLRSAESEEEADHWEERAAEAVQRLTALEKEQPTGEEENNEAHSPRTQTKGTRRSNSAVETSSERATRLAAEVAALEQRTIQLESALVAEEQRSLSLEIELRRETFVREGSVASAMESDEVNLKTCEALRNKVHALLNENCLLEMRARQASQELAEVKSIWSQTNAGGSWSPTRNSTVNINTNNNPHSYHSLSMSSPPPPPPRSSSRSHSRTTEEKENANSYSYSYGHGLASYTNGTSSGPRPPLSPQHGAHYADRYHRDQTSPASRTYPKEEEEKGDRDNRPRSREAYHTNTFSSALAETNVQGDNSSSPPRGGVHVTNEAETVRFKTGGSAYHRSSSSPVVAKGYYAYMANNGSAPTMSSSPSPSSPRPLRSLSAAHPTKPPPTSLSQQHQQQHNAPPFAFRAPPPLQAAPHDSSTTHTYEAGVGKSNEIRGGGGVGSTSSNISITRSPNGHADQVGGARYSYRDLDGGKKGGESSEPTTNGDRDEGRTMETAAARNLASSYDTVAKNNYVDHHHRQEDEEENEGRRKAVIGKPSPTNNNYIMQHHSAAANGSISSGQRYFDGDSNQYYLSSSRGSLSAANSEGSAGIHHREGVGGGRSHSSVAQSPASSSSQPSYRLRSPSPHPSGVLSGAESRSVGRTEGSHAAGLANIGRGSGGGEGVSGVHVAGGYPSAYASLYGAYGHIFGGLGAVVGAGEPSASVSPSLVTEKSSFLMKGFSPSRALGHSYSTEEGPPYVRAPPSARRQGGPSHQEAEGLSSSRGHQDSPQPAKRLSSLY